MAVVSGPGDGRLHQRRAHARSPLAGQDAPEGGDRRLARRSRRGCGQELLGAAGLLLKQILANGPLAVALCIEAVDRGLEMDLDDGLNLEANHFGLLSATDDMQQGMSAFLEKREPRFIGR